MYAAFTGPAEILLEDCSCHVSSPIPLRLPMVLVKRLYEKIYKETAILPVPLNASLSSPLDHEHMKDPQAKTA